MPAPLIGIAAGVAARAVAKKLATKTAKKVVKKVAEPKSAVKVVPGNAGRPNANFNELLRKGLNKDSSNTALLRKSGERAKRRASQVDTGKPKATVKINTNPTKPKGVFGPLKKQLDISSGAARGRSVANAKALKGLKPLKTKKK